MRISGDSLRLRLSQAEVDELRDTGRVSDTIQFGADGANALGYELVSMPGRSVIDVQRRPGMISVRVPTVEIESWTETDRVGIETTLANARDGLRVVLEKDWQCLSERAGEDETDLFPHPDAAT